MSNKLASIAKQKAKAGLTLKVAELINAKDAIDHLITQTLPAEVSFRLARIVRQLDPVLQDYEATRKQLCERYGKLDAEQNIYQFEGEQREKFQQEFDSLLESEVQIPGERIPLTVLKQVHLSTVDALNLEWLISE